jgi:hypothetical protein
MRTPGKENSSQPLYLESQIYVQIPGKIPKILLKNSQKVKQISSLRDKAAARV